MAGDNSFFTRLTRPVFDTLANLMSGGGTNIDPRTAARWLNAPMADIEVENVYRGSWLMRKIVDLPAYDMTRAWRDWQAEDSDIALLEEEEARLHVKEKIRMAVIMGRLGGGALIMGDGAALDVPLESGSIGPRGLKYLFLATRSQLKAGQLIIDPENDAFGEPETFELTMSSGVTVTVHHSRMLVFKGQFHGNLSSQARQQFWGDSVVQSCLEAVNNATSAQNEFASLIAQAKIDVYKMPGLMANAANPDYERRFTRRMELANVAKSNFRALIMDADEEWEQRQLTLSGMPELVRIYIEIVAGAADIPATRLLGKSPDGMNATGDSDQSNYEQMIRTKQENELRPILEKLDEILIPSAGVKLPIGDAEPDESGPDDNEDDEIYFEFAPLTVMGETDAANVENKEADSLSKIVLTGLFEDAALEEAFSNRMIESGRWPGYERARKKALAEAAKEPTQEDVNGVTNPPAPGDPNAPPGDNPTGGGGGPVHIHITPGGASSGNK